MLKYLKIITILLIQLGIGSNPIMAESNQPIATDSRIKTFVYNENEVFPIVLHYGYQTGIEFAKGEFIQTYSVGNNYAWQFNIIGRTLFIKPMEENILTNMTVITNKRRYYFELQSKMMSDAIDQDLAYAVRFFYPDDETDRISPKQITTKAESNVVVPVIKPYNFNYSVSGPIKIAPSVVFDDNQSTFFKYENGIPNSINITTVWNNEIITLDSRKIGDYLVVNHIGKTFEISIKGQKVNVVAR